MQLYLSSFRLGSNPDRLVELVGEGNSIAVIANAMDSQPASERVAGVARELALLSELGLRPYELDLRTYFSNPGALASKIEAARALWIRGGNLFVLRAAMFLSGADVAIPELVRDDQIVYAGYSAGPCVLAPSLKMFETVDPPEQATRAYGIEPIHSGLALLPYTIVPHTQSPNHPATAQLDRLASELIAAGVDHKALRDGEALVVTNSGEELVGRQSPAAFRKS